MTPTGVAKGHSKAETAYQWLRGQISTHAFGPGHRLVLAQLAEQLGMSVVPVREALRRLEAEGSITYERNIGATVTMSDEGEYAEAMEALAITEGAATALSAPHLSEEELTRAAEINTELEQLVDSVATFDPARFTALNRSFHEVVFSRCPNAFLCSMVTRAWSRLDTVRESTFSFIPARAESSVREHAEILELIRTRASPAEIESTARQHRLRTLHAYVDRRTSGSGTA